MKTNQHIVPRNNGWGVKKENGLKVSRVFRNKKDAVGYAKDLTEKSNSCVVVHDNVAKFEEVTCSPYRDSWSSLFE